MLELINLVGFLVFSFAMDAAGAITRDCRNQSLSWFKSRALYRHPESVQWHDGVRDEVVALFDAIAGANSAVSGHAVAVHPPRLLRAFLDRMLMEADRRVDPVPASAPVAVGVS